MNIEMLVVMYPALTSNFQYCAQNELYYLRVSTLPVIVAESCSLVAGTATVRRHWESKLRSCDFIDPFRPLFDKYGGLLLAPIQHDSRRGPLNRHPELRPIMHHLLWSEERNSTCPQASTHLEGTIETPLPHTVVSTVVGEVQGESRIDSDLWPSCRT